jgi:hypothetical protein
MKSPYKFLDYYGIADSNIFFGRRKEIDILLADIDIERLVVLFAKTGTGKTSLINAGVIPRLEQLGYHTIYARVEEDPTEALFKVLRASDIPLVGDESLVQQLEAVEKQNKKPVVVFFDQFEEFFFYVEGQDSTKAQAFVQEIGRVYRDPKLRVHIVFSLREDFYGGMDIFRDEIPSIFHLDSSLRLLPFDASQARQAIMGPAEHASPKFDIESELTDKLITDLTDLSPGNRIEPAHLQIICDTLWQRRRDNRSTLQDYMAMGGAIEILNGRMRMDLDKHLSLQQLIVFAQMLDLLTDRKRDVKRPRQMSELIDMLVIDAKKLEALIRKLIALRLVRERSFESTKYIEWVTDYVAKTIDELDLSVRTIATQKRFKAFLKTWRTIEAITDRDKRIRLSAIMPEEFRYVSMNAELLNLESDQAIFMLLRAMEYNFDAVGWLNRARALNVDAWHLLETKIAPEEPAGDDRVQGDSAVQLLGDLLQATPDEDQARRLMAMALDRDWLAASVVQALGSIDESYILDLLRQASRQEALVADVISVVGRTPQSIDLLAEIVDRDVQSSNALEAIRRLDQITKGRLTEASVHAGEILAQILDEHTEELFSAALDLDFDMKFWFDAAQARGIDVWSFIRTHLDSGGASAANAVNLLGDIATTEAVDLLQSALRNDELSTLAENALKQIIDIKSVERERLEEERHRIPASQDAQDDIARIQIRIKLKEIAEIMSTALAALQHQRETAARAPVQEPDSSIKISPPEKRYLEQSAVREGLYERDWDILLNRISGGKCTPLLGPGIGFGTLPLPSQIALDWAKQYNYPLQDADKLTQVAQYLAVEYDLMFPKEKISQQFFEGFERPDFWQPDEPHGVLAQLPFSIYLTTNYDDFMVQALKNYQKEPIQELLRWRHYLQDYPSIFESRPDFTPTPQSPLVFHLYGQNNVPESLVLTEDDYMSFLVNISKDQALIPPRIQRALSGSALLFIGYSLEDFTFRVLFHGLIASSESSLRRLSVMVQLPPSSDVPGSKQKDYIGRYLKSMDIHVYWGTSAEFIRELGERWKPWEK